jgi:hypothetical protein
MRRSFVLLAFFGWMAFAVRADAQTGPAGPSVLHTKWKTYYLPITDSITVTFGADSMTVTTSAGTALLQSVFQLANHVLTLHDYGGEYMCPDLAGTYHVRITDDTLILIMDDDHCDARGGTLMAKRWIRVPAPPAASPAKGAGKGKKRG